MRSSLRVFRNPKYSTWMVAEFVSSIAGWVMFTVQLWIVMTGLDVPENEAAGLAGFLLVFQFLPQAFLSPVAGWLGDRIPRRRVLVTTQVALAGVVVATGSVLLSGNGSVVLLFASALVSGIISAFDMPTKQAAAADYVDPLDRREALVGFAIVGNVSRLIGPALAGVLIVGIDPPMVLILTGGLFLVAATVLFILPSVRPVGATVVQRRGDVLRVLRARPVITLAIIAGFLTGALGFHTSLMMTSMVLERGLEADSYSVLSFSLALGTLLGATMCMKLPLTLKTVIATSAAVGLAMILVSTLGPFTWVVGGVFLFGLGIGSSGTLTTTFVQVSAPPESMGRVLGIYFMVSMGISPLSAPLIGFIIDHLGVSALLLMFGSLIVLFMTVLFLVARRVRHP